MRVLVTGAAGFIGTHLVKHLWDDGHRVTRLDLRLMGISTALNREGAMVVTCPPTDIRDDLAMGVHEDASAKCGGYDACVHLAAIASPNVCGSDPATAWSTNVQGTFNVLGLCRWLGVKRVVFMSSAHCYGISPKYLPTDETHPRALLDVYTATKVAGEDLCEMFWLYHGLSYCALRLFNAYGPGQSDQYFVGRKLAEAKAVRVTMRTPLRDVTKDWIHVSDVCRAIALALASDYVGAVNVGTGVETRLADIAETIAAGFGVEVEPEDVGDPGPTRMCADWSRAKNILGWSPKITIEQGLAALIKGAGGTFP